MAVLRHRALALFLVCLVFTLLCLALLPPSRSRSALVGRHTSPQSILGLGLENKSPQIELLRSEPSSSHHIVTIYSSIAHKIKS